MASVVLAVKVEMVGLVVRGEMVVSVVKVDLVALEVKDEMVGLVVKVEMVVLAVKDEMVGLVSEIVTLASNFPHSCLAPKKTKSRPQKGRLGIF